MTNEEAYSILDNLGVFPKANDAFGPTVGLRRRKKKNVGYAIYVDNDCDIRLNGFYSPETLEAIAAWLRDPVGVVNAK